MKEFIRTRNGLVNLAHVASIEREPDAQGRKDIIKLYRPDGEFLDYSWWSALEYLSDGQYVPAPPGYSVVEVYNIGSSADDCPVFAHEEPVIAFRFSDDWDVQPCTLEGPKKCSSTVAIKRPDGRLTYPHCYEWENVEALIAHAIAEHARKEAEEAAEAAE
jgi:hypothetical protein